MTTSAPRVGVLALQGAFREHRQALERCGARVVEVRLPRHLDGLAGVVIPGGESTTMAKLMRSYGLDEALLEFHEGGGWLWGSCAGAILLASDIVGYAEQPRLGLLDMSVARNDYGRQVASFEAELEVAGLESDGPDGSGRKGNALNSPFRGIFIRAPRIVSTGPGAEVLATWQGEPVFVAGERLLATVFHPELAHDDRLHQYFVNRL